MPPPTPQDLAFARSHAALNGGAFENPWNANLRLHWQATPLENPGRGQGATPHIGVHGGVQHTQAATQLEGQYQFELFGSLNKHL